MPRDEPTERSRSLPRREFLQQGAALAAGAWSSSALAAYLPDLPRGERPPRSEAVEVAYPLDRVPLSFIIDDSTCLVNLAHFALPQFAEAHPDREVYKKPWKTWPREIPDSFVRAFGEWCAEHGVKGKYSVVPNPACVGWLDRELPGWSRPELLASLRLVRELLLPNWDIHPEMITHTRVIDLATGRPLEEISIATMENSYPQSDKSVDELAAYLAYALRILEHCDLPCEGITTPGGFGGRVQNALSLAVHEAVRDVYRAEIPHYFKYVTEGDESTEPIVEHVRGLDTGEPRVTVNIPAGTGDWYGGWEGDRPSEGHRYANEDASAGRMVEHIEKRRPAVMLCHWPGLYSNGSLEGFHDFQKVVTALETRFGDETRWMKLSELARYWAARELTAIASEGRQATLGAPFACPDFTLRLAARATRPPVLRTVDSSKSLTEVPLSEVKSKRELRSGAWCADGETTLLAFDLPRGETKLSW